MSGLTLNCKRISGFILKPVNFFQDETTCADLYAMNWRKTFVFLRDGSFLQQMALRCKTKVLRQHLQSQVTPLAEHLRQLWDEHLRQLWGKILCKPPLIYKRQDAG